MLQQAPGSRSWGDNRVGARPVDKQLQSLGPDNNLGPIVCPKQRIEIFIP